MKYLNSYLVLILFVFNSCNSVTNQDSDKDILVDKPTAKEDVMNDTTPKVTGIGGIFFQSKNLDHVLGLFGMKLQRLHNGLHPLFEPTLDEILLMLDLNLWYILISFR